VEPLETLTEALEAAQAELGTAEIALCEATARAQEARANASKLEAAVAALSGEPPAAATVEATETKRPDIQDLSPEEFDAQRKKRQRQKQKEAMANNPYAHVKCSGCGQLGTLHESIITAPSGAPVRMMACGSCGNQIIS